MIFNTTVHGRAAARTQQQRLECRAIGARSPINSTKQDVHANRGGGSRGGQSRAAPLINMSASRLQVAIVEVLPRPAGRARGGE